jgi:GDP-4-dehydro-6-deoxy-D-mannose reductase
VTGANGLLGSTLVARSRVLCPGAEVLGIDLTAPTGVTGEACDLADLAATRAAVARIAPDVVFHCAGGVSGCDLAEFTKRLVVPTRVLADALIAEAPSAVLVIPGSAAEYGTLTHGGTAFSECDEPVPVSPYGIAKAAQTQVALDAATRGLDARVGRVFNLIGPGISADFLIGRVVTQLAGIAAGVAQPRMELGSLASVRDFVDIRDACDGLIAVAERGAPGRVYNICSGVARTSREAVEALVRCSGLDVEIAEEAVGSPRAGLDVSVGDPSRAAAELGWRPAIDFGSSACDAVAAAREGR